MIKGFRKHKVKPKICVVCGTVIEKETNESYKQWGLRKSCSPKCYHIYTIGRKLPPRTPEHCEKISKGNKGKPSSRKGAICSKETKKKISKGNKNKVRTLNMRINMSLGHTKETEFNGFKSKINKRVYASSKYKIWRNNIFKQDNFICQNLNCEYCKNKIGCRLHAHHIKRFSFIIKENMIKSVEEAYKCEELWDTSNGITFCEAYHKNLHKKS